MLHKKNNNVRRLGFFSASSTDVLYRPKLPCSHLFGQENFSPSRQKDIIQRYWSKKTTVDVGQERCDEDMTKSKGKDPLEGLGGPMTRARARKAKEALQQVLSILFEYKPKFQGEKSKVVSCIMAQMEED